MTPGMLELWTQREAAHALKMSVRYLRESDCPKVWLPSNKAGGRPTLRYHPETVMEWALKRSRSAA